MDFDQAWLAKPGFSWLKAYALASASKLTYASPTEMQRVLHQRWRMGGRVFSIGDTQGFVATGDRVSIVAFRGTEGLGDWLHNIDILGTDFPPTGGRVHGGFVRAWSVVGDLVRRALDEGQGRTVWFTGHSLGGAIAVLAAAAEAARKPAGVVTFGQPRLLDRTGARTIANLFGQDYVRIVNDTDVVARVPPFYRHAGRLFHFDFVGNLRATVASEGEDGDDPLAEDGPPPLSEAEFAKLRAEVAALDRDSVSPEAAAVEGIIPGVEDHRIDAYVQLARRQAFPEAPTPVESLSSLTEEYLGLGPLRGGRVGDERAPEVLLPVLLRLRRTDWTPPSGVVIGSTIGAVVTARVTATALVALETDPNVAAIEASRSAGLPELGSSVGFVKADVVHRPPVAERGKRALVGIVDTGVDILHEAFRGPDGTTRILAIWDQDDPSGPAPATVDPVLQGGYGRLWRKSEIDAFIAAHAAGAPTHGPRLRDPDGHGTHVAAIAAGRATARQPDGIAPDAGIVVVMSRLDQTPGNPFSIGYSNAHVDALAFLRGVADGSTVTGGQPRPIAINVSQGMNAGAHDGSTTLEAAFDMATGMGRDPGIVIVKSAGNERGQAGHAMKRVFDGVEDLRWLSGTRLRAMDYFEAWFDGLDDIAFALVDPSGNRSTEVSVDARAFSGSLGGNLCHMTMTGPGGHPDNGHHRLTIEIHASPEPIRPGEWRLEMTGRSVVSDLGAVNVWVERDRTRAVQFLVESEEMTLSVPGTARTVICVGACNSSLPLRLTASSSWGLTRDGRRKPELCAPGMAIISAKSNEDDLAATVAKTGTSMAAPHVAGALALVLSARAAAGQPQWNAVQLRNALETTARSVPRRHHPGAGFGVLDVEALMQRLA